MKLWQCICCRTRLTDPDDQRFRWNGERWQHLCSYPGGYWDCEQIEVDFE